ncbi:hypothetical protein DXH95_11270 [Sphingorhabdus pulchriflava]|uniref:Uncharacterized protein n=1 Tax=Sphingorhabdus pulchriflava TaxID=2292257 RepID=A0A371B544_9SPHN|nr:hypothetical protein [Sphingorhabdus pulchriflava]RDV02541.1 hypothetical protein DXH95_11270 [Sphingorhabdus pulchriflava]
MFVLLSLLATQATEAPPPRSQAVVTASVTIIQLEVIGPAEPTQSNRDRPRRQIRNRAGVQLIEFY